jgi:hypothetical protein
MTPAQQKKAISILKKIVLTADKETPNETGFCDHEDTLEIRILLIEIGAMKDRREKRAKHGA